LEHKSEIMMQTALANDWKAQVKPTIPPSRRYDEIVWDLYCVRDQEKLHVQWTGNRLTDATYKFYDKETNPTHKAAVLKIIEGAPSFRGVSKDAAKEIIEEDIDLPFDLDSPALVVLKSVIGRDITWVRKIDGEICNAFVPKIKDTNPKYLRVFEARSTGRRILEWSDAEGFHAVALEQIIGVS
jgi:hypothetical protein